MRPTPSQEETLVERYCDATGMPDASPKARKENL
jgi:hypothetical protein